MKKKSNTYEIIRNWLEYVHIYDYTINDDLTVDVNGTADIENRGLTKIPVQFGRVSGDFICCNNLLTSLKGCPSYVGEDFYASSNRLTSLKYGPKYVDGVFFASSNLINTLDNFKCVIKKSITLTNNQITSLKSSIILNGELYCSNNNLPDVVNDFNTKHILFKYHEEYGIWNSDGSFNKGRWDIFNNDYESGLLK